MQDELLPFHLPIPVSDLAKAREFYLKVVGCKEVRSTANRVDFSFFGHHNCGNVLEFKGQPRERIFATE
jgi:extradiol dioxygenase family protein